MKRWRLRKKDLHFTTKLGKKMHAVQLGSGEKVIFLIHGWANNWKIWQEIARLDKDDQFTFVALELLGFGSSDRLDHYDFQQSAGNVIEFIRWYQVEFDTRKENSFLGGLSLGSLITAESAYFENGIVSAYILMGPVFRDVKLKIPLHLVEKFMLVCQRFRTARKLFEIGLKSTFTSYLLSFVNTGKLYSPIVRKYGIEGKRMVDIKACVDLAVEIARYDLIRRLNLLNKDIKMLMILGSGDRYLDAQDLLEGKYFDINLYPNLRVREIEGSGHTVSYEMPQETFGEIMRFLT